MTTILIVEDDPTIGILLQEVIQRNMPSRVIQAICADEAIKIVEDTMPDLLLLDYFLPDTNGIELYDHLQCATKEKHIPAIMLTASLSSIMPQLQERQIIGMSKPFHITELTSLIAKLAPLDIC